MHDHGDGTTALRRGRPGDAAALAAVHRAARAEAMPWLPVVHTPAEDDVFFHDVVLAGQEVWVAERNGAVVGFVARGERWLEHLYVAPESQGCGVGRALLERAQEPGPLQLYVFTRNARARRFYAANGWQLVAQSDGSTNEEREPDCTYRR